MNKQLTIKNSDIHWINIDSPWLEKGKFRLDGSFYCGDSVKASFILLNTKYNKIKISNLLSDIFYPGRFKRTYVSDKNGEAFFSSSEMMMAYPRTKNYLSREKTPNLEKYRVFEKTILISRSGTVGNVTLVSKTLNGSLVSEHAIRLIPKKLEGYLYAYLKSSIGYPLLIKGVFGAVVDEVEPDHIENIPIPLINEYDMEKIHNDILQAFLLRDQANELIDKSQGLFYKLLALPRLIEDNTRYLGNNKIKAWDINEFGFENRLDGSFYYPLADIAIEKLKESKIPTSTLANKNLIDKIILPGRFKRIYVKREFGIPFLSGKNIVQFQPGDLKYLSPSKTKKLDTYIINKDWALITCSGAIGRTALVNKEWDGWAATQHILRVVPNNIRPGYLFAFLSSDYGQVQIRKFTHGSVVDEITDKQMENVYIAVPNRNIQKQIGEKAELAFELRAKANEIEDKAIEFLNKNLMEAK